MLKHFKRILKAIKILVDISSQNLIPIRYKKRKKTSKSSNVFQKQFAKINLPEYSKGRKKNSFKMF